MSAATPYLPETFMEMQQRFPILSVVVKNITCSDSDKELLRNLFLEVYCTGFEDGMRHFG